MSFLTCLILTAIFTRRNSVRRVVYSLAVNHELDMVEITLRQLNNLVDVYLISESNVTTSNQAPGL